jgi:hypothetical protein
MNSKIEIRLDEPNMFALPLGVALRGGPLADDKQGGAEESVEGIGGGFVFGDGGLDGLLRGGALVAEIEER